MVEIVPARAMDGEDVEGDVGETTTVVDVVPRKVEIVVEIRAAVEVKRPVLRSEVDWSEDSGGKHKKNHKNGRKETTHRHIEDVTWVGGIV
jgi:hypothetical protein